MRKRWITAVVVFAVLFTVVGLTGRLLAQNQFSSLAGLGGMSGGLALLTIEGPISAESGSSSPLMAAATAGSVNICDRLYSIAEDSSVKAVVIRLNTPGGSAAGSDEIYRAVMAVRQAGKPVVVSMGDVAASGGYYIASAADYVYANPATLTGSIGVIFSLLNWEEGARKLGIRDVTLHAGQYKDIGSPWRDMTAEERGAMEGLLQQVHEQFIKAVDEGRQNLDEKQVRALATGMIFTGEKALDVGLIDGLGGLHAAEAKARELGKLPADAKAGEYGQKSFFDEIFGVSARDGRFDSAAALLAPALESAAGQDALSLLSRGLYMNATLRDLQMR